MAGASKVEAGAPVGLGVLKEFVSKAEFKGLEETVAKGFDQIIKMMEAKTATPAEAAETKAVEKAVSDQAPVNPAWTEKAIEIIGEAVDHCEVFYPKAGGQIFTVVIKRELSNAPTDYLERMKSDRRSKEIGNEGIEGVEAWCKLIKLNLTRK